MQRTPLLFTLVVLASCSRWGTPGTLPDSFSSARASVPSATATPVTIYSFPGGANGDSPTSDLVYSSSTKLLYGTTYGGGATPAPSPSPDRCARGCGSVYSLDAIRKRENVVYRFEGAPDGAVPIGDISLVGDTMYGTTAYGGRRDVSCPHGCGTLFSVTTAGREKILYRFGGGADGANPAGAFFKTGSASSVILYGATQYGGKYDFGTIFSFEPALGSYGYEQLYAFGSRPDDGKYPAGNLVRLGNTIYGVTTLGGKYAHGTVFQVTPSADAATSQAKTIYDFTAKDGDEPVGLDSWGNGNTLYIATSADGPYARGSILALTISGPTAKTKWVYGFKGDPDGAIPLTQPRIDVAAKALFGSTHWGGRYGVGTVYRITIAGSECVIHSFEANHRHAGSLDGASPASPVRVWSIGGENALYGATVDGGKDGLGTVYAIASPAPCESAGSVRQR